MDMMEIKVWVDLIKGSFDIAKSVASSLPQGAKRNEIETKISVAEKALASSDVQLAKILGMNICDCTFPPQIMLWREAEKAHVCPNKDCGRAIRRGMNVSRAASNESRNPNGPNSWMRS